MAAVIPNRDDDISFRLLLNAIVSRRWLLTGCALVGAAVATAACLLLPPTYVAQTTLSPVTSRPGGSSSGSLGNLSSQLGSLASLAGIAPQGDSEKWEAIALVQSRSLIGRFLAEAGLVNRIARTGASDAERTPDERTRWKAVERFRNKLLTVVRDNKTGLVALSVAWRDPQEAAQWANSLVRLANDTAQSRALEISERSIKYLTDEVGRSPAVETRQAIAAVLQSELSSATLARGTPDYAFRVIDPAVAPARPSSPRPLLWIPAGAAAGLVIGIAVLLLVDAFRREAGVRRRA